MVAVKTITQRAGFVALTTAGARWVTPAFVVQYLPHNIENPDADEIMVGFTATKKIGGAVQRNRAKRRLRALFDKTVRLNENFPSINAKLVLIARQEILARDFVQLEKDLWWALRKLNVIENNVQQNAEQGERDEKSA